MQPMHHFLIRINKNLLFISLIRLLSFLLLISFLFVNYVKKTKKSCLKLWIEEIQQKKLPINKILKDLRQFSLEAKKTFFYINTPIIIDVNKYTFSATRDYRRNVTITILFAFLRMIRIMI